MTFFEQSLAGDRGKPPSLGGPVLVHPNPVQSGTLKASLLIASASLPKEGESLSGDRVVVRRFAEGALVAVVDVLGHGPKASEVAELATHYLDRVDSPPRFGASRIIDGLHGALKGTRGAAAMVCVVQGESIEGCGVGNVELRAVGVVMPVVLTPGILGAKVREYRAFSGRLSPGAHLFLFSDGISRHSPFHKLARLGVERACQTLIADHRHAHDDASAVVLAYEAEGVIGPTRG